VIQKIKKTIEWLKSIDKDTLAGVRMTIFFFVVIDMFGFYWWLKWKSFAMAMFITCAIILIVILLLERRRFNMEETEKQKEIKELEEKLKKLKEEPKEEKKKSDEEPGILGNLGLPDPDEYNKRLEKAIGTGF